jgi:hypothetical protein
MEGDAVNHGDQEKGPMCATFCLADIAAIVDREEDMGGSTEVWERFT